MATMTPAALFVGFCATMTVIALGRLVVDDERRLVDVGSTSIVFGITVLSTLWVAIRQAWLSLPGLTLLALGGLTAIGIGVRIIVKHWYADADTDVDSGDPSRSTQSDGDETDGEQNRA
jgi:hypothetical protein